MRERWAPTRRVAFLLGRALGAGVLGAHVSGVLLFALVVAVEAADQPLPMLGRTVLARVPALWAQAAAVLGCVGAAAAALRLRRRGVVLALGTLGVDPRVILVVGALVAGGAGAASGSIVHAPADVPGAWERGDGGWIRDGQGWPDAVGGLVRPRGAPGRALGPAVVNAAAAGACGAAIGLWAGATPALVLSAILLVADVVGRGLAERGAAPAWVVVAPALFALVAGVALRARAPLFPRRWE